MRSISTYVLCPFFCSEKAEVLKCEGYIDGTCMVTKFPSRKAKLAHIKENCVKMDGGNCFLANNLYEKYKIIEEKEREASRKRTMEEQRKNAVFEYNIVCRSAFEPKNQKTEKKNTYHSSNKNIKQSTALFAGAEKNQITENFGILQNTYN